MRIFLVRSTQNFACLQQCSPRHKIAGSFYFKNRKHFSCFCKELQKPAERFRRKEKFREEIPRTANVLSNFKFLLNFQLNVTKSFFCIFTLKAHQKVTNLQYLSLTSLKKKLITWQLSFSESVFKKEIQQASICMKKEHVISLY